MPSPNQSPLINSATSPTLLCMKGHPGTGKSTLARALASDFGWPLIDKDDIKDHTWALTDGNELSYTIMWQLVTTQLRLGLSVVVDSPLARPTLYQTAQQLAQRQHARLLIVQTSLSESEWQQRLAVRSQAPSPHKPSSWAAMAEQLTTYAGSWDYPIDPAHLLVVDSAEPIAELVAQVRRKCFNPVD